MKTNKQTKKRAQQEITQRYKTFRSTQLKYHTKKETTKCNIAHCEMNEE